MVGGYGVGYILHEDGLTSLGLRYDERTLTLTYRGEEVHYSRGYVVGGFLSTEIEFLVWEEWGEVLESYTVAYLSGVSAIYLVYACEREVLLTIVWRTHMALHHITCFQTVAFHLLHGHIHVIGRREIVVVA